MKANGTSSDFEVLQLLVNRVNEVIERNPKFQNYLAESSEDVDILDFFLQFLSTLASS